MAGEINFGLLNRDAPAEAALAPIKGMGAVNALISQDIQNQQQQFDLKNALAEQQAYKQAGGDVTAAQRNLMSAGLGKQSVALGKSVAETEQSKMKALAERLPIQREMAKQMALDPSPQTIMGNLDYQVKMGWMNPQQAQTTLQSLRGKSPQELSAYFTNMATKAEDFAKYLEDVRHNKVSENISGGNLAVAQGNLGVNQAELALKQKEFALKNSPEGQQLQDVQANRKALKTAGYNPETGEDKISELIKKSTSGRAEAWSAAVPGFFGYSTSGMEAIKELETYSNKMALDLLNGKLGAGISNEDRKFILAGLGDVANPDVPADARQAAWKQVVERMRTTGMIEPPKGKSDKSGTSSIRQQADAIISGSK